MLTALGLSLFMVATHAERTCNEVVVATAPDSRFRDNGNGTVTDRETGLIWKQCAEGLSGTGCATGSAETFSWQAALLRAADSDQWRLPNKNELASLVERRCYDPAINEDFFPNTPSNWFWSSSPYASNSYSAWHVNFVHGGVDYGSKYGGERVRLIMRAEQ
ncbi:DUF1566 domain-containing protein [Halochromatium salexigens]|nr:DUF1566 domain-containing protein [Halochromatium salexigens]